jgi:hypothetical protein
MKSRILFLALFGAALVVFPSLSIPAETATDNDAVQMVNTAGQLIEVMGNAALAVISNPFGKCCDRARDLYVFVYSDDVVLLANSMRSDVIGVSFKSIDPGLKQDRVSEMMVEKAMKEGSGWTDYPYINPGSELISVKHTYSKLFQSAGKNYIVCCGVWHDKNSGVVPSAGLAVSPPEVNSDAVPQTEELEGYRY